MPLALLDEAKEKSKAIRAKCSVGLLDDDLRAEVDEVLEHLDGSPTLTASGIAKALAARGVKIQAGTLRRHKRGECSCEPG